MSATSAYGDTSNTASSAGLESASLIETVVVTGRHRLEKAQDVPLSVSVVAGDELKLQHDERIADFANKIPNFSAVQQNTRVSEFSIRGVGGNVNNDGVESGVGLIVDNVVFTHVGFSWFDFVDLDHIEVLRGPQGTLLGKNTTIGAVVITTKEPSFTPEADVSVTYGSHDKKQFRANVSAPIIDDVLAFRLTASADRTNGWVKNNYNSQKFLDTNRWSVRGQLLFTPVSAVKDRLIVEHQQSDELTNYYPIVADPNYSNGATRTGWSYKLTHLFGYTPGYDRTKDANLDTQGTTHASVNGISNELNWTIGGHTLTSISAYRSLRFRPYNDSDYSSLSIFRTGYDVDVAQASQEIRITSPVGKTVDYQGGIYLLHEKVESNYRTIFYADATKFLTGSTSLPSSILNGVEYDQDGHAWTDSYGTYAQATWHATDSFDLTAGLRYTYEHKAGSDVATSFGGATLTNATLLYYRNYILTSLGGSFSVSGEKDNGSLSWLINPSYRISENVLTYFSVSHGEKSGGVNTTASASIPVIIKPEKATDYEFGAKTNWLGDRLIVNLGFYWNNISDYQASATSSSSLSATPYLTNAASVRQRGVELEARYAVTDNLFLSVSGAYNDSIYKKYTNAPAPIEHKNVASSVDLSGTQLPGAPKWSGQFDVSYDQPIGDGLVGFAYVNETLRSGTDLYNHYSSYSWQGGYGLTNAGIGIKTSDGQYSLLLWSKNLFDHKYLLGINAATNYTPAIGVLGDTRSFGVTLNVKLKGD